MGTDWEKVTERNLSPKLGEDLSKMALRDETKIRINIRILEEYPWSQQKFSKMSSFSIQWVLLISRNV